jgi:hypothetical protein
MHIVILIILFYDRLLMLDDEMEEEIAPPSKQPHLPRPQSRNAVDKNKEFMHMFKANRLQNKPARLSAVRVAALVLASADDLHHLSVLLPSVDLVGMMMCLVMADVDLFRTHYDVPTVAAHSTGAKNPTNTYTSYVRRRCIESYRYFHFRCADLSILCRSFSIFSRACGLM